MPKGGLGFSNTFGNESGSGSTDSDVPFADYLDGNGQLSIALANANTYGATANFQQNNGAGGGIQRIDKSNENYLILEADIQSAAAGYLIAGKYFPVTFPDPPE